MLKFLFTLIAFLSFLTLNAQQIDNIKVNQEGDNVVITFDLIGSQTGQTFNINVVASSDAGRSYNIVPISLSGDLSEITAGNNKKIIWNVLNDIEDLAGDRFVFKLTTIVNNPKEQNPINNKLRLYITGGYGFMTLHDNESGFGVSLGLFGKKRIGVNISYDRFAVSQYLLQTYTNYTLNLSYLLTPRRSWKLHFSAGVGASSLIFKYVYDYNVYDYNFTEFFPSIGLILNKNWFVGQLSLGYAIKGKFLVICPKIGICF